MSRKRFLFTVYDRRLFVILFALFCFFQPKIVQADVAPPPKPAGSNLFPDGEITQVRMMDETVILSVFEGHAVVTATFHMMNTGSETENMYARFPVNSTLGYPIPTEIKDLKVRVDGDDVETSVVEDEYKWEEFYVSFPPEDEVIITVTYTLEATGWPQESFVTYDYILETGSGWNGAIGSVDIILHLPYKASAQNVFLSSQPGGVIDGNDIRWHYDNLEPSREDNFSVRVSKPVLWTAALTERDNVNNDPSDDEAWGRLGKAYKILSSGIKRWPRSDAGGKELFYLSVEAYEKAVALDPDDALWHAGFGELLALRYEMYYDLGLTASEHREIGVRAMEEYHTAYMLDPDNPTILEMIGRDQYALDLSYVDGEYIFLGLTKTPTVIPAAKKPTATTVPKTSTPHPTSTQPTPTHTAASVVESTPSQTPVSQAQETSSPSKPTPKICASIALFPVAVSFIYFSRKKKI